VLYLHALLDNYIMVHIISIDRESGLAEDKKDAPSKGFINASLAIVAAAPLVAGIELALRVLSSLYERG
jgi:hypothetical protein